MDFTWIETAGNVALKGMFWVAMWLLWGGPTPSQIIKDFSSNPDERRYYERYHSNLERIEALRASLTKKTVAGR
ncbi:hypothetical protein OIU34_23570 [Pararhizobium sp. BT-229]|uniref:hypothetical protein n=1 Tax=Pararhizobium sp. BT-229 TaxID=2986923 RepID=UPI0021F78BBD|nr:hypothetical protein [Pararhizobium sp. BT-229]MCV9964876.1 hypothetical protein [Pararhizobium sp. BT-229]